MRFCFFVLFIFSVAACSSTKKSTEQPVAGNTAGNYVVASTNLHLVPLSTPVIVDGDIGEWGTQLAYMNNTAGISTALNADTANLYVAMHVTNQLLQMKILKRGMQVYFDVTATEKETAAALSFPVQSQFDDGATENEKTPSADYKTIKQNLINNAIMVQTKGLNITNDGMHTKKTATGIQVALNLDVNSNLVYEAAIPLKDIYGADWNVGKINNSVLSVGFKINGFPKQAADHGTTQADASAMGQGKGFLNNTPRMAGGRGMRGGRNNGGSYGYDKAAMALDKEFWIKAKFN